jgi:flagellar basal-body rod protein FlgB
MATRHEPTRQPERKFSVFNQLLNTTTTSAIEQVASFTETRHSILAGNVANLDTPGYRVRDLSVEVFQQRLREAIEADRSPPSPGVRGYARDEAMRRVRDSMQSILQHDQSNVGLEQQVTEIAKNQYMHNLAISIMRNQFQMLETAISERV